MRAASSPASQLTAMLVALFGMEPRNGDPEADREDRPTPGG
jgi:hypothetical protein